MFQVLFEMFLLAKDGIALKEVMQYGFSFLEKEIKNQVPLMKDINKARKTYKNIKKKGIKQVVKDKYTPNWLKSLKKALNDAINPYDEEANKEPSKREKMNAVYDTKLPWYLKPYKKNFVNVALYIQIKEERSNKQAIKTAKRMSFEHKQLEKDFFHTLAKEEQARARARDKEIKDFLKVVEQMQRSKEKQREEMLKLIEDLFNDSAIDTKQKAVIFDDFSTRNKDFKSMFVEFINDVLTMTFFKTTKKIRAIELVIVMAYGEFRNDCIFIVKSPKTGNFSVLPLIYNIPSGTMKISIRSGWGKREIHQYSYRLPITILEKAMSTTDYGKNFFWRYTPPTNATRMPKYKARYEKNKGKYSI